MGPHVHLGTRQTRLVTFLPQPLHHVCHMNMKLGGPQIQPGCCGDLKNLFPRQNLNHNSSVMQPTAQMLQRPTLQVCVLPNIADSCSLSQRFSHSFWEYVLSVQKKSQPA